MATLVARQGRHRQLYADNRRLVSGCIPYRWNHGGKNYECSVENCVEVLMVTSPNRQDLVFPKGGWENDETVHEAACREAFEEAGVKGNLNTTELGVWEFRSKSRQAINSLEGGCRGYMFALEVTEEFETWPEQENHGRKWLKIRDAFMLCRYDWMKQALTAFLKLMKTANNQMVMDTTILLDCQVAKATSAANRAVPSTEYIANLHKAMPSCSTLILFSS